VIKLNAADWLLVTCSNQLPSMLPKIDFPQNIKGERFANFFFLQKENELPKEI
jgi:hypothetical protein